MPPIQDTEEAIDHLMAATQLQIDDSTSGSRPQRL